jgi:predicted dehydrogenase
VRDGATAAAAFAAAPMIVPRHVLGGVGHRAPSRTLNVAMIGFGGMGFSNYNALLAAGENVVAVCDVDYGYVERSLTGRLRPRQGQTAPPPEAVKLQESYTKAKKYDDFRVMLEKEKGIDAVVIATPDHLHALQAYTAMKMGKHVYVQKPLTYSVQEARVLARTARDTKVVTQMGNQGHSMEGTRRINEIVASGVLGPVREVHVWTDRPHRHWAQGVPRPTPAAIAAAAAAATAEQTAPPRWNLRTVDNAVLRAMAANPQAMPKGLNWDFFLGPARELPYHPVYHPFSWRGWVDFGVSAIGDMGAHLIDQPFWALNLDVPTSVEATSSPWGLDVDASPATFPQTMTVHYEFAARGAQPPVKMNWYDGGLMPPRPDFLPDDIVLNRAGGGIFVGSKGIILYDTYGNNPRLYPASLESDAARVPKTIKRVTTSHEMNWANAIMKKAEPSSDFAYAAKLTETMLLGVAALRAGQGVKLKYDGAAMRFTNNADANQFLTREYRAGWSL